MRFSLHDGCKPTELDTLNRVLGSPRVCVCVSHVLCNGVWMGLRAPPASTTSSSLAFLEAIVRNLEPPPLLALHTWRRSDERQELGPSPAGRNTGRSCEDAWKFNLRIIIKKNHTNRSSDVPPNETPPAPGPLHPPPAQEDPREDAVDGSCCTTTAATWRQQSCRTARICSQPQVFLQELCLRRAVRPSLRLSQGQSRDILGWGGTGRQLVWTVESNFARWGPSVPKLVGFPYAKKCV